MWFTSLAGLLLGFRDLAGSFDFSGGSVRRYSYEFRAYAFPLVSANRKLLPKSASEGRAVAPPDSPLGVGLRVEHGTTPEELARKSLSHARYP